uniref:Uncharacterized protein n=1 Tax=Buteo japonicus TaxID=224669 RepID=A0A8B9Z478_9AVES
MGCRCTDTEEDQLLEEPDIQYSSKVTQHPSIASSIAESKSSPGSDGASSPEGPELVYIPAKPAQLAAHVLGNTDSFYSVRDVATSVQTLHEDSQTSEHECTPVEGAAEDPSAVPAADASVEAVRSQPGAWSQSSIAGELGPSDSQADVSTNYVNQGMPSCNKAEVTSTTEVVSLCWDDELIMDAEVLPYVEQFPQKIIIPFVDQTAYLLKIKQPLNVAQGLSTMTSGSSADDLVCHPERTESTVEVESAELSRLSTGHQFCKEQESWYSPFLVRPSPASLPCGNMCPAPALPSWRNPPGLSFPAPRLPGTAESVQTLFQAPGEIVQL